METGEGDKKIKALLGRKQVGLLKCRKGRNYFDGAEIILRSETLLSFQEHHLPRMFLCLKQQQLHAPAVKQSSNNL